MKKIEYNFFFTTLEKLFHDLPLPSVSEISARYDRDPFAVLISTIISLRTKDAVTIEVSEKFLNKAPDIMTASLLSQEKIASLLYPSAYYKNKSKHIKKMMEIILTEHNGKIPSDRDELLKLPGVGIKTANLVAGLVWDAPYICVDTHVHRISNRLGFISTRTAEESEVILTADLPAENRVRINELMVLFGQQICVPVSPKCSKCPFEADCPKVGVDKSR